MNPALLLEIKTLIVDACEKDVEAASIGDYEPLFGSESALGLDSLDALQISMAIQKRYGMRLTDSKETRRLLSCVAHLAEHLDAFQCSR
jgi:acyl carrier protein